MPAEMSRTELTTHLQKTLQAVISRRMGVSLALIGEAGIGKTHLSQQVFQGVPCPCLTVHANISATGVVGILPRTRPWPHWAERQLNRSVAGERLDASVFLSALVAALGQLAPLLIQVEDWHDAPAERQSELVQLAQMVNRTRGIGLVVTSRRPLPAPFKNHQVPPLNELEMQELMRRELSEVAPGEAVDWVTERTKGNPLFTLEFLRYLRKTGALWHDARVWQWRAPHTAALPVTVEAMLEHQLQQHDLTAEQWQVLRARSVFLPGVAEEPLRACWPAVAEMDDVALQHEQQDLQALGLLRGSEFSHPLFGEVIRAGLGIQLRQLSALAFAALREHWPELAFPLLGPAGADQTQARTLLNHLLDHARARGDDGQVANWLVELAKRATGLEKQHLTFQAAEALHRVGRLQMALEWSAAVADQLPEAAKLQVQLLANEGRVEEAQQALNHLPAYLRDGYWFEISLRMLSIRGLYQDMLQLWTEHPDRQPQVPPDIYSLVGNAYAYTNDLPNAEAMAAKLLSRSDPSIWERFQAFHVKAHILFRQRDWEQMITLQNEMLEITRHLPDPLHHATALMNLSTALELTERFGEAQARVVEARSIYLQVGDPAKYATTLLREGNGLSRQGAYDVAEAALREAHTLLEQEGRWNWLAESHIQLADLYLDWLPPHGLPLAARHADAALNLARQQGDVHALTISLRLMAQVATHQGRLALAEQYASELFAMTQHSPNLKERAEAEAVKGLVLAAQGKLEAAQRQLESALSHFQQAGTGMYVERWGLELDRLRGDRESALRRAAWLKDHGFIGMAMLANRYFPALYEAHSEAAPSSSPVRFRVLGTPQLELAGKVVPCRARKRLELLICLLEARLAGHAEVPALGLVDQLYPEQPETVSKQAVKQLVYLTRNMLGNSAIQSTPNGYQLGQVTSDAEEFLHTQNVALWQGPYLAGFQSDRASTVQDALTSALQSRVEDLQSSDAVEAARLACILSEMEPYDEQILQQTVSLLVATGQKHAAMLRFGEARKRFRDLGVNLPSTLDEFLTSLAQAL